MALLDYASWFHVVRLGAIGVLSLVSLEAFLYGNLGRLTGVTILSWGLAPFSALGTVVFYTDAQGNTSSVGVTSVLLVGAVIALVKTDGQFVRRFLQTLIGRAFIVLVAATCFTQIWHLGVVPGVGLTWTRAVAPMMVVALLAYVVSDAGGARPIVASLVASVAIAIIMRYAAEAVYGSSAVSTVVADAAGEARVSGIGSWTIYGTICAAAVALAIGLAGGAKSTGYRLLLMGVVLISVREVAATGTRGALLGLGAVFAVSLQSRARRWAIGALACIAAFAYVVPLHFAFSGSRELSLNVVSVLSQQNTQVRFERNQAALDYIIAHPFSGSGLGIQHWIGDQEIGQWVYNPYLAWGTAAGLPALVAFAVIVVAAVAYGIGNWIRATGAQRIVSVSLAAALVAWLVNQFTTGDSLLYLQPPEATFFFYGLIGTIIGCRLARFGAAGALLSSREELVDQRGRILRGSGAVCAPRRLGTARPTAPSDVRPSGRRGLLD